MNIIVLYRKNFENMLTEEQKRKIEEKRTKALEKLMGKTQSQPFTSPVKNSSISIVNVSPSSRKRPILNLTQQQQSTECIEPGKISKTSFSPKFKKQKQNDQEEFNPVRNDQSSPSSKTLPKTSYSPKFKNSMNNFYNHDNNKNDNVCSQPTFKRNIVKSFDQIPYSNKNNKEAKQKIEENCLRDSNEQKTSFSPSLKKKSATDDPLLNEASTARQKIPAISFSPKFKKKPLTMISTTESNTTINLNATNSISISNELNSTTNDILSHEFIDVIDTKRRAEENRKKALEKLKNKQTAFGKSSLQSDLQRSSQETESRFFVLFFCPNKFFYNIDFQ